MLLALNSRQISFGHCDEKYVYNKSWYNSLEDGSASSDELEALAFGSKLLLPDGSLPSGNNVENNDNHVLKKMFQYLRVEKTMTILAIQLMLMRMARKLSVLQH